jgi:anti-sigma factor RsiW
MATAHLGHLSGAYLEGGLDAGTAAAFEAHVAICPQCARVLHELREALRAVGERPDEPLPATARARLMASYRAWRDGR